MNKIIYFTLINGRRAYYKYMICLIDVLIFQEAALNPRDGYWGGILVFEPPPHISPSSFFQSILICIKKIVKVMEIKVLSSGIRFPSLPQSYIRPESERPRPLEVSSCDDVPIVDLGTDDRAQVVQQIGEACSSYGFFQVHN